MKKTDINEQDIIQQDKLASLGQLSAGIAHEISNPLGYINSNIETARVYLNEYREMISAYKEFIKDIENDQGQNINKKIEEIHSIENKKSIDFISEDLNDMFDDIEDGLDRITKIVSSLRAFSRQDNNKFEEYDLNRSINNTLLIINNDIKYNAKVKKELKEIPKIQANGNKIDQALLNIMLNASAAIKEKKAKNIKKQARQSEDGLITITTSYNCGYVSCVIEDNGIGIENKDIDKIFDPFYTSKPVGKGTGLGLSIAYEIIVTQHNGCLYVESKPMVGTKFTVLLPIEQNKVSGEDIDE